MATVDIKKLENKLPTWGHVCLCESEKPQHRCYSFHGSGAHGGTFYLCQASYLKAVPIMVI